MTASAAQQRRRPRGGSPSPRPRGFVLVVVLVLAAALSLMVAGQVRQAASAQTIGVNSADYVMADAAVQSVLRYCESAVMRSAGRTDSVRVTTPGLRGRDVAASRDADKWAKDSVAFDAAGATAFPGVSSFRCLFEDATADLVPTQYANDLNPEHQAGAATCTVRPGLPPQLCKYRITARVTLTRGQQVEVQSEMRFAI